MFGGRRIFGISVRWLAGRGVPAMAAGAARPQATSGGGRAAEAVQLRAKPDARRHGRRARVLSTRKRSRLGRMRDAMPHWRRTSGSAAPPPQARALAPMALFNILHLPPVQVHHQGMVVERAVARATPPARAANGRAGPRASTRPRWWRPDRSSPPSVRHHRRRRPRERAQTQTLLPHREAAAQARRTWPESPAPSARQKKPGPRTARPRRPTAPAGSRTSRTQTGHACDATKPTRQPPQPRRSCESARSVMWWKAQAYRLPAAMKRPAPTSTQARTEASSGWNL